MREILFKAKRVDNGEWVEGDLVHSVYKINDVCVGKYGSEIGMYQIDPETICQYTGLTDKNGNKIWENDIVNGHEKRGAAFFQCVVKHNDRKARFDVEAMGCMFPLCIEKYDEDFFMNGLDYEVIGNVFDNADLLKGEWHDSKRRISSSKTTWFY